MPLIDRGGVITAVLPASVRIAPGRDMPCYYPMEKVDRRHSGATASWSWPDGTHFGAATQGENGLALACPLPPLATTRVPPTGPIAHSRCASPESLFLFDTNDPAPCNIDAQGGRRTVRRIISYWGDVPSREDPCQDWEYSSCEHLAISPGASVRDGGRRALKRCAGLTPLCRSAKSFLSPFGQHQNNSAKSLTNRSRVSDQIHTSD